MDILLNKVWSTYQNNFTEKSKTHNYLKRNTLGNLNFLFLFILIIQSILFDYEALIVPLIFRIKQQPWFGWENSLFLPSSYKFVFSSGCWAETNTWESTIWWLYREWFNSMTRKHSGVFAKNVLWYNTCFAYPNTDWRKKSKKITFRMKPTTIQKSFKVKIREKSIVICRGGNSE